jgi:hypothetical protein
VEIFKVEGYGVALVGLQLGRIFLGQLVVAVAEGPFGLVGLGSMGSGVGWRIVARQHTLVGRKDFAEVVVELIALVSELELAEEHTLVVVEQLVFADKQLVFELGLVVESIS